MKANRKMMFLVVNAFLGWHVFAAGTVSGVKARQRYPWNGKVDIDCTLTGEAGKSYGLKVSARDKVGGTNLTVTAVSVEGETATGNPVSVTSGVYRLVWDADKDLPNGFRGEKVSISVTVTDQSKKYMIVDLQSGAITYQENEPSGWDMDQYKSTKMVFVRIDPGTFTQYSVAGMPGRQVTITKPYYIGVFPVTHKQLRTLVGASYSALIGEYGRINYSFNDTLDYYSAKGGLSDYSGEFLDCYAQNASIAYRGSDCRWQHHYQYGADITLRSIIGKMWPLSGHTVYSGSPLEVLRSRTGLSKFDLPTEAQATMARPNLVWDGYTLCLDCWNPWLGINPIADPQGDLPFGMDILGQNYYNGDPDKTWVQIYTTCVGVSGRGSTRDISPYTRFCLYEAD